MRISRPHILAAFSLFVLFLALLPGTSADLSKVWVVEVTLDSPDLKTPAVQWAIFSEDPVQQYRATLKRIRNALSNPTENTGAATRTKAQMIAAWDGVFKAVTGDRVNLLTTAPQGWSSDSEDGPRWIATKTVNIRGEPVCWCERIDAQKGASFVISFTPNNRFDLRAGLDPGNGQIPPKQDEQPKRPNDSPIP